ncbi:MAG: glycosyltransferase family 4 protein [Minisyncoccia bacterium]
MKRILIFSLAYYPRFVSGAEVAIKEITDRISPEEIEFHLITLRFDAALPREERIGNVIVHRIGFSKKDLSFGDLRRFPLKLLKPWYQLFAVWHAIRLHREYHFDGTWAMMAHSAGVPAVLFKMCYPRVPYLLTLQEGDPPEYIERRLRPVWFLFKRAFTEADVLQTISTFLLDWGRKMGFAGYAEVIPNGVDAPHFAHVLRIDRVGAIRAEIGKGGGETWLIHTGRLAYKNGLDVAIRALPLLPEQIHFFMIGDGHEKDLLIELSHELGVSYRAHFHPYVPNEVLPDYLHACDIFIRPSRSEGMGNSFIEAMAAGLPVIATQEGGIADFLFDAKRNPDKPTTGWAVDVDSPEQIATAVQDILARPDQVARVTATARALVVEKYDWNLIGKNMKSVFDRLLEKR